MKSLFNFLDEIEQRAGDEMSGNELEVMIRMGPKLLNAGKTEAAEQDVKALREGPLKALAGELKQREGDLSGDNAERIRRIGTLLEALTLTRDVFSKMGSFF